jgi:hypothetical protein
METPETDPTGDYPEPQEAGTTLADERHVSLGEAEEALDVDQAEEELPGEDPDFEEDDEEL